MTKEAAPASPEPERTGDTQATVPQPQPQASAPPATPAGGPYQQAAFVYPADTPAGTVAPRSRGTRLALLIVGAVVVAALLFTGGFWTGSVVSSIPGMSDGRFGDGDPRFGPGGRMGDGTLPRHGEEDPDSGTDSDGSADITVFTGS